MKLKEKYLDESLKHINTADRMIYVTYPSLKEEKFLLKIFLEIGKAIISSLNAISANKWIFRKKPKLKINRIIKILRKHGFSERDIQKMTEILDLNNKYKKSVMEFERKEKVVMMQEDLQINIIDARKIKDYLSFSKKLYLRASFIISN